LERRKGGKSNEEDKAEAKAEIITQQKDEEGDEGVEEENGE